jgi:hypothetical protein
MVTGPVSMPFMGLAVRLCAYLDQATVMLVPTGRYTSPKMTVIIEIKLVSEKCRHCEEVKVVVNLLGGFTHLDP